MHRSTPTHQWWWCFEIFWNLSVWVPSIQWRTIKVRSWILKAAFQEWPSFWKHLRSFQEPLLVLKMQSCLDFRWVCWFCWNWRVSRPFCWWSTCRGDVSRRYKWLTRHDSRYMKIDCHEHMIWKYCISTDFEELQCSNWSFGSNPCGKLPSLHFTRLHKSHGRPRSWKTIDQHIYGWPQQHVTSFEQVYIYIYIYILYDIYIYTCICIHIYID